MCNQIPEELDLCEDSDKNSERDYLSVLGQYSDCTVKFPMTAICSTAAVQASEGGEESMTLAPMAVGVKTLYRNRDHKAKNLPVCYSCGKDGHISRECNFSLKRTGQKIDLNQLQAKQTVPYHLIVPSGFSWT